MDLYADIVKPVAAEKVQYWELESFAAGLGGAVIEQGMNWKRSIINIYSTEDDYIYECQAVLAKCSACGRRFYDVTFTDNDGSMTGCPHCGASLNW